MTSDNTTPRPAGEPLDEPLSEPPAEPFADEPLAEPPVGERPADLQEATTTTSAAAATAAPPEVVYVDAPQRPHMRGTRGVGVVVVLLSTSVFAVLYALATVVLALALRADGLSGFGGYLVSAPFLVPVLVFAGAHLLLVLAANRSGWWIHVLGGFVVGVLVWVAFLGAAVVAAGAVGATAAQQQAVVLQQLGNPLGIIAAVLAREIPIWVGGIVSRRGRAQSTRNAEAQAAYESELAEHRASVRPEAPRA
jgi:hypothetical protein